MASAGGALGPSPSQPYEVAPLGRWRHHIDPTNIYLPSVSYGRGTILEFSDASVNRTKTSAFKECRLQQREKTSIKANCVVCPKVIGSWKEKESGIGEM